MTNEGLVAGADANLLHAVQTWAKAAAAGRVCEEDGLLIAASGVPIRSFNNAFFTRPLANSSPHLGKLIAYFESLGVPFRLRVRDDVDGITEDVLAAGGLHRSGGIPCLVLSPITACEHDRPALEMRRVTDDCTLRHHVEVVAAGFDWLPALVSQVFSEKLIGDRDWRAYVGYVGGQPVASSQLVITDRVAGIYWVATLEAFRRRGFGEAMTWHAVEEGVAAGCDAASLQASPMGYPIYERMGFRTVMHYRTFIRQEV